MSLATCHSSRDLIYRLTSILERVSLTDLFGQDQPLEVELGSGDGSFLVNYATMHPERNFLGVERLLGRLRKLDRKGQRAGLANLCGVRIESAYFLEYLLPRHSATALHIYFPDPWPKRKHRRHRLVNERFPALAQQALAPGGTVYLRTDDTDYFAQMRAVFDASALFRSIETPAELAALLTDFEREFQARGIQTLRAAYEVRPGQPRKKHIPSIGKEAVVLGRDPTTSAPDTPAELPQPLDPHGAHVHPAPTRNGRGAADPAGVNSSCVADGRPSHRASKSCQERAAAISVPSSLPSRATS